MIMCDWYLHIINAHPPFLLGGDDFQSQIFKMGDQKRMSDWGALNEFLPWIFSWGGGGGNKGKNKGSISNVDLRLF